ncbi:hypothetical protein SHIRM173S_00884 [Streptomyces hirsutus]
MIMKRMSRDYAEALGRGRTDADHLGESSGA